MHQAITLGEFAGEVRRQVVRARELVRARQGRVLVTVDEARLIHVLDLVPAPVVGIGEWCAVIAGIFPRPIERDGVHNDDIDCARRWRLRFVLFGLVYGRHCDE